MQGWAIWELLSLIVFNKLASIVRDISWVIFARYGPIFTKYSLINLAVWSFFKMVPSLLRKLIKFSLLSDG